MVQYLLDRRLGGHFGREKNTNEKRNPHFVLSIHFSPGSYTCRDKLERTPVHFCVMRTFCNSFNLTLGYLTINTFLTAHAVLYIAKLEVDWMCQEAVVA
jgi:hypothetical protein